ncbi:hypothetical protein ACRTH6_004824, partial [Escherichia coli]
PSSRPHTLTTAQNIPQTNTPAHNLNAITTRSDAEKIKSAPPPARSAFPASPARFMQGFKCSAAVMVRMRQH